jgi:N-methylhydantoinase A
VCGPSGLSLEAAAWGIHLVANSNIVRAIKTVSVERGRDPDHFAMMAFGGSGPLHAAMVARDLGIRRVLIPPSPGVFSAFGLLAAPIEQHGARSVLCSTRPPDGARIAAAYESLRADMYQRLQAEGLEMSQLSMRTFADLRYRGQSAEITVPFDPADMGEAALRALEEAFEVEYARTFGHRGAGQDFEFVTARIVGGTRRSLPTSMRWLADTTGTEGPARRRQAYFGPEHGWIDTPVVGRDDLGPSPSAGPLLVVEYDTTVVVPPGCGARLDEHRNIVLDIAAMARAG